jgi:hypothetical protein
VTGCPASSAASGKGVRPRLTARQMTVRKIVPDKAPITYDPAAIIEVVTLRPRREEHV